jgi:hypothetical protein
MGEVWGIFVAIGVAVLIGVAIWEARPLRERQAAAMAAVLLAGCYLALVLASRLIADPGIPLDDRLMAPLLVLVEVAMVLIAHPHGDRGRHLRECWSPFSWHCGGARRCV